MIEKIGNKFTKEYKDHVATLYKEWDSDITKTLEYVHTKHPNALRVTVRRWVDKDFAAKARAWADECNERWKEKHPEKYREVELNNRARQKERYKNDPIARQKKLDREKKYIEENSNKIREQEREYCIKHKDKIRKRFRDRKAEDLGFKLLQNMRFMLNYHTKRCLRNYNTDYSKLYNTQELLGCTREELADHLRQQYTEGMTDENYGEWHVDHIIPCSSFDVTKPEQAKVCFHYTNLQPLWAEDNLRKGKKII